MALRSLHSVHFNRPILRLQKKLQQLAFLPMLSLSLFGLSGADTQGALIGLYEFRGNLENSQSGSGALPGMTEAGNGDSGFSADGWYWSNGSSGGKGLNLETPSLDSYSIGISFRFSAVDGYKKVLDFSGLTSDDGFYLRSDLFSLYISGPTEGGYAPADTLLTVILTRDSGGELNLYVNGSNTPLLTKNDPDGAFSIRSGNELNFFMDENSSGEFSRAGSVSYIGIWDTALSREEITEAFSVIPEPGFFGLLGGLGVAALVYRGCSRRASR